MALNMRDVARIVAKETGLTTLQAQSALWAGLDAIARATAADERVTFTNFGTFESWERPAHVARNPQTGEMFDAPAKRVVRFRPTGRINDMVRNGDITGTIRKEHTPKS